jgi:hypothetical protein
VKIGQQIIKDVNWKVVLVKPLRERERSINHTQEHKAYVLGNGEASKD